MIRRYRFKLYPNRTQAARMDEVRLMHQRLYNAALEERIDCYAKIGKTLTAFDQAKSVTIVRRDDPDYAALSSDSLALTCKRLDLAFKHFFRRAKQGAGKSSGFPRFKPARFYPGWDCRENGKGWKMEPFGNRWRVRFKGIDGWIKCRGRFPAEPRDIRGCTVTLEAGVWWLSVAVEIERERACGHGSARLDWDIDGFAVTEVAAEGLCEPSASAGIGSQTQGIGPGFSGGSPKGPAGYADIPCGDPGFGGQAQVRRRADIWAIPCGDPGFGGQAQEGGEELLPAAACGHPDFAGQAQAADDRGYVPAACGDPDSADRIAELQRKIARCVKGSSRRQRLGKQKARLQAHEARARREALHRFTTDLVHRYGAISVADDEVLDFTKSARGTERDHGAVVKDKAAANRSLLDTAPGTAIALLAYKLAEAGGELLRHEGPEGTRHLARDLPETAKTVRRAKRKLKRKAA